MESTKTRAMAEFIQAVSVAKYTGEEWVETTPEIIAHFNPQGLGGAKHFTFENVKICEVGKLDEVLKHLDRTIHDEVVSAVPEEQK